MRYTRLPFVVLFSLVAFGQGAISHAKELRVIETVEGKVGQTLFVKLPGNPSAGYGWQLNKGRSNGLNLVEVDMLGWLLVKKGRPIFFMPQSAMNVAVHPKSPGKAELAFDYSRQLGGRTYTTTSMVRVLIHPKATTP